MAAQKSFRQSQLIAFDNVAAGHDGVLSTPSGELVVKPCKQSEIDFYESTSSHPEFVNHIPTFLGRISLGSDTTAAQASGVLVLPSETSPDPPALGAVTNAMVLGNDWAPSNGGKIQTDVAIVLDNVAAGYKKPNILDVKLGARLWADDAPVAKRAKLDKVAEETTSKPLGFRVAGMKTFQGAHHEKQEDITLDGYRLYDKMYGRSFNVNTVHHGFEDYFLLAKEVKAKGSIKKVVRRFIENLKELEGVIEKEESRMYSASVLFVYEGDQEALQEAFTAERDMIASFQDRLADANGISNDEVFANGHSADSEADDVDGEEEEEDERPKFPAIQTLKLIDFAHAEWTPGQGPDENILHGIRNVIKILDMLAT